MFPSPYYPPSSIATAQEHQRAGTVGWAPFGSEGPPLDQPHGAVLERPEFEDGKGLWSPDFTPEAGQ